MKLLFGQRVRPRAEELLAMDDNDFNAAISEASAWRLGDLEIQSKRHLIPLYMRQAKHYVQDHVILIGDAAHTIHPLAGMGVNLGLADVKCLQQLTDINAVTLRDYASERKFNNKAMAGMMRLLQTGFGNSSQMALHTRSLGSVLLNQYNVLDRLANAGAMGVGY